MTIDPETLYPSHDNSICINETVIRIDGEIFTKEDVFLFVLFYFILFYCFHLFIYLFLD